MSLASLTIDLVLGLNKFEQDSGKAAQIATRDSERMTKAAARVSAELKKQADQAGRTQAEYLAIAAAEAGVTQASASLLQVLEKTARVSAEFGAATSGGFKSTATAAQEAAARSAALTVELVKGIDQVTEAYRAQVAAVNSRQASGVINTDQQKAQLRALEVVRATSVEKLKAAADEQRAADAVATAENAANEKRRASVQLLLDKLNQVPIAYRKQIEELNAARIAGDITPKQFQAGVLQANAQRPDVQAFKQREAAARALAEAEVESANRAAAAQVAAGERFIQSLRDRVAAIGQTREAQQALEATKLGVQDQARGLIIAQGQREFLTGLDAQITKLRQVSAEYGLTTTQVLELKAAQLGVFSDTTKQSISELKQAQDAYDRVAAAAAKAAAAKSADEGFVAGVQRQIEAEKKLAAEFGKTEVEVLQLEAAQRGLGDSLAPALAQLKALKEANAALGAAPVAETPSDAFINQLTREREEIGKTREQLLTLKAARLSINPAVSGPAIAGLGNAEFVAGIEQQISAQQRLAVEFDKTETEILQLRAAERGLTQDTAASIANLAALKAANQSLADAKAKASATSASNEAFVSSLEREALAIGKTRAELIQLDAAQRGLTDRVAPLVNQIIAAEANLNKFGRTSKVTQFQLQQLHYTLSDVIASLASGISPLTILAQQGGQINDAFNKPGGGLFGGFTQALKAIGGLITPVRLAIGGLALTGGAVAYAFYEGSKQSKAFADAIVLTGNAAGQTEGQFNALVRGLAKTSDSLPAGAVREFGQALISTGQVGPKIFASAAEAATRFGEATGKTAKDVATDFAGMADDVTKWAVEHNKQLNFLKGPQLVQIRTLQEEGRAVEAQAIVYDALNERLRKLEPNLGTIEKTLKSVSSAWKGFWDRAYDIGRTETIDDKLADTEKRIAALKKALESGDTRAALPAFSSAPKARDQNPEEIARKQKLLDDAQTTRNGQLAEQGREFAKAQAAAADAVISKEGESARASVKALLVKGKAASEYQDALKTLEAQFRKAALDNTPFDDADKQIARAQLKKQFTDRGAVGDESADRKAQLEQNVKDIQNRLQREKDILQFGQQELQAIYNTGTISLKEFYDKKRANIAEGVEKEIDALREEQALLQGELDNAKFTKPADRTRVQTQLNESIDKSAQIQRKAAQDIKIANIEEGTSFQRLAEQVSDYQAQLFQLEGNDFAASQVRQQQALVRSAQLLRNSGGAISEEELARQIRAIQVLDAYSETQRKLSIVTADANRAEEAYLLRVAQGGINLQEQETGVYQIRATALVQLGELAEKAKALADASTDPKILQFANDLALAYQKAALAVDPALTRLREAATQTSSDVVSGLVSSLGSFSDLQRARNEQAAQETAAQRKDYTTQIDDLRSSLKNISDAKQRAAVLDRIKDLEAKRRSIGDQDTFLKTLERDVLGPALKKVYNVGVKLFIEEPLEALLKSEFQKALTDGGPIADFLRRGIGAKNGINVDTGGQGLDVASKGFSQAKDSAAADGLTELATSAAAVVAGQSTQASAAASQAAALTLQTNAITTNTFSLTALDAAARAATQALAQIAAGSGSSSLSGLFSGGGQQSGATGGIDFSGTGYPLADGTNYVPYDGFRATLHKGEGVTPAKYNPAAGGRGQGGGGGVSVQIINAGNPIAVKASETSEDSDGNKVVKLVVDTMVNDVNNGGKFSSALTSKMGAQRQNARRN